MKIDGAFICEIPNSLGQVHNIWRVLLSPCLHFLLLHFLPLTSLLLMKEFVSFDQILSVQMLLSFDYSLFGLHDGVFKGV
jgi:hypothetical protein